MGGIPSDAVFEGIAAIEGSFVARMWLWSGWLDNHFADHSMGFVWLAEVAIGSRNGEDVFK